MQEEVEEEVEEVAEKVSQPLFSFFGGGGRGRSLKEQAVHALWLLSGFHPDMML